MKFVLAAAAAAAFLIPAAASAQTAPATQTAPAAKFSLDTPIETLVADEKAKAALTAGLGVDVTAHPMYENFKTMSLREVQPMSGGAITDEMMANVEKGLAAIK